jgi:hypothetical protein
MLSFHLSLKGVAEIEYYFRLEHISKYWDLS